MCWGVREMWGVWKSVEGDEGKFGDWGQGSWSRGCWGQKSWDRGVGIEGLRLEELKWEGLGSGWD